MIGMKRSWNKVQRLSGFNPISVHMFNNMIGRKKKY